MIELKDGAHTKTKWVIRHYREIEAAVKLIERRRPKLVSRIRTDENDLPIPLKLQPLSRVISDRHIAETYIEGKEIMDIVAAVLSERLREKDSSIMADVCLKGMSVTDAAKKHDVSEKTVKRARLRMRDAYNDELTSRNPAENGMSSANV